MTLNVAINGFGRIGRNILRAIAESGRNDLRVVAINDLAPINTSVHLLKYDSVHGKFPKEIILENGTGCKSNPKDSYKFDDKPPVQLSEFEVNMLTIN